MKNVQIRDGADNATLSIFRATDEEFSYLFPNPGQDIEIVEDFIARHHEKNAAQILNSLWLRPVHKTAATGIHGTLYYDYSDQRCQTARKRDPLWAPKRDPFSTVFERRGA